MSINQVIDCDICCESINKSTRKLVNCTKCDIKTCLQCVKTYITNTINDAHCIGCKNPYDMDYMLTNIPKTWVRTIYKEHTMNVLVDREVAKFGGDMYDAERKKIIKKKVELMRDEEIEYYKEMDIIKKKYEKTRNSIEEKWLEDMKELNELYGVEGIDDDKKQKTKKVSFFGKCATSGECDGLLSAGYACLKCEIEHCKSCRELKHEGDCNADTLSTLEQLKKDTKPCPKCKTPIFKISGCYQMWCPQCHCTFDWNTLEVDNGNIHNPHYIQFLRTMNDNNNNNNNNNNLGDKKQWLKHKSHLGIKLKLTKM